MASDTLARQAQVATGARRRLLELGRARGTAMHLASALSAVEILSACVAAVGPGRDDLVLSKGHAALALYAVLTERSELSEAAFAAYGQPAGPSIHPERGRVPTVTFTTGSLGHGIGLATGSCLGRSIGGRPGRSFVVLGDGECQEGSVWEAAAAAVDLDVVGLTAVVDANGFSQYRRSAGSWSVEGLARQFAALGWTTEVVDGHDTVEIADALGSDPTAAPRAVIARSLKGHGSETLTAGLPGTHFAALGVL
jgi:transketolase